MTETGAPYEQVFFDWFGGAASIKRAAKSRVADLYEQEKFSAIKTAMTELTPSKPERLEHEYFKGAKPCTMLIDEVEALWARIAEDDDWSPFKEKLQSIAQMRDAYGFNASRFG